MPEKTLLLKALGDSPGLRIVDFFLENRSDYSKKEIVQSAGMSKTTFYKVWKELEAFRIVRKTRQYGRAQLYALNIGNPVVKKMMALDWTLGRQAMESAPAKIKQSIV
mgnify:CR=1 FL=1